jgi:peptidoglycan/xylan/chitin deacetylase (PgdA/CDA1 family)
VEAELSKNAAIIRAITGKPSLYFRPPGGHASKSTIEASTRLGLTGVFWTLLCSPYEGAKSGGLADYVIKNASDGAIVLMHNGEPGTTAALPKIVVELKAKGYKFVTISELLSPRAPA